MYYYDPQERQTKELVPGARTRTFWGDRMLLSLVELDPNSGVTDHTHPHEQAGIVLEGELDIDIAGDARLLKPGDVYIIPGNVVHRARSTNSPARLLEIFSPVREEFKY